MLFSEGAEISNKGFQGMSSYWNPIETICDNCYCRFSDSLLKPSRPTRRRHKAMRLKPKSLDPLQSQGPCGACVKRPSAW